MAVKRVTREEEIRADIKRLHALGYAQELYRAMGGFSNFAISFTIISILSGTLTLFTIAYSQTGPIAASVGWPLVSIFVTIVGLAMAELASAYPTAGGLYFWSSKLGGPGWGWFTGWFNLIGQFAITAGIDYGLATFAVVWINIKTDKILPDPPTILIAYAIVLVLHALMNIFGVRLVAFLNDVSVWWHILGVLAIFIALFAAALLFPTPASSNGISNSPFYFGYTNTGYPFWYAFLIGLLLAQYTFTGYDASAHMTEETIGAETKAPWGIVMSIVISAIAGYILAMGLLIGVRDVDATAKASNSVLFILADRLGDNWAFILLGVIVVAQFFCGMSSVTANSRMIYAFSRDHAMPLSNVWHTLSKTRRVPVNAIWLAAAAAFILAVPSLWNAVAYGAVTSIAVIGLYVAYVIPVYLRRMRPEKFEQGVWNLGRWSGLIGWIAIVWVVFICLLFMLPVNSHETSPADFGDFLTNFNYTPFVFAVVFLLLTIWYLTSVRHWFKGPVAQGDEAQLEAIEAEFGETLGIQEGVGATDAGSGAMSGGVALAMEAGSTEAASRGSVEVATMERAEVTATEVQEVRVVETETVTEEVVSEVEQVRVVERQTASGRIISEFERDFSGHLLVNEVHVEEEKEPPAQERKAPEKKSAKKKIVSEFERDFGGKETS